MGTLVGHVAPGFGFFIIGLWHLYNHIKLYAQYPNSYTSLPWFPTSKIRYFELFLIMGGCVASIAMELFISPDRHQPFDSDGTIPSNHLHNFEFFKPPTSPPQFFFTTHSLSLSLSLAFVISPLFSQQQNHTPFLRQPSKK
ncbi:hypothetical protein CFP56_029434 [Quercus suber]|uniref:Uncharacterized protein n=1 Tax=Quercus suber TaxID=58331 RepID=A0AAW0JQV0_QUESU